MSRQLFMQRTVTKYGLPGQDDHGSWSLAILSQELHPAIDHLVNYKYRYRSGDSMGYTDTTEDRPHRTRDREVTVPAILAAAEIEFALNGFAATRTESIATR